MLISIDSQDLFDELSDSLGVEMGSVMFVRLLSDEQKDAIVKEHEERTSKILSSFFEGKN